MLARSVDDSNEECTDIETIADIFAGTGSVSSAFADKTLITNRGLVDKKNSADPFVIALAKQEHCKVVTEEVPSRNSKSPKIPDVCNEYKH